MALWLWKKILLDFVSILLPYQYYLPLEKRLDHLIEQTWNQGCFVPYWLTLDQLPLEKKILSMYISYLFISNLTLERHVPLHLYKIDSLKPRIHCARISWNLPKGSKEEDFEMFWFILFFCYYKYLPFEMVIPVIWTNLNDLQLSKHCADMVDSGQVALE